MGDLGILFLEATIQVFIIGVGLALISRSIKNHSKNSSFDKNGIKLLKEEMKEFVYLVMKPLEEKMNHIAKEVTDLKEAIRRNGRC